MPKLTETHKIIFCSTFSIKISTKFFNEIYKAGDIIKSISQTKLDLTLIMPEMDSPLNLTSEMMHGTSNSKTSIFTWFDRETCFVTWTQLTVS